MKLYVVRHGESEANRGGFYAGQTHSALTEKGFEDAKGVCSYLGTISFDKVYTSDLKRARQTAETALPDCEYEETMLLREIDVGNLVGKKVANCRDEFGEDFLKNRQESNYEPYGGENREMIEDRAKRFLDKVAKSDFECVAAFSHAGMMRTLLKCVLQAEIPLGKIQCTNCTVAVFEYRNDTWQLCSWINPKEIM